MDPPYDKRPKNFRDASSWSQPNSLQLLKFENVFIPDFEPFSWKQNSDGKPIFPAKYFELSKYTMTDAPRELPHMKPKSFNKDAVSGSSIFLQVLVLENSLTSNSETP